MSRISVVIIKLLSNYLYFRHRFCFEIFFCSKLVIIRYLSNLSLGDCVCVESNGLSRVETPLKQIQLFDNYLLVFNRISNQLSVECYAYSG